MTLLHMWLLGKSFPSNQIIWALGRSKGDIAPAVALALLLLLHFITARKSLRNPEHVDNGENFVSFIDQGKGTTLFCFSEPCADFGIKMQSG